MAVNFSHVTNAYSLQTIPIHHYVYDMMRYPEYNILVLGKIFSQALFQGSVNNSHC